jgi:predicted AAA+ superfamily ATPase
MGARFKKAYLAIIFTANLMAMFPRRLRLPSRSFLLLGPRGTGKTTWLRGKLPGARWFNLLLDGELVRLTRDPALFRQEVEALPARSWIVVDEIQKLPALLNEIHDLSSRHPRRWRFALTGSSARKLRAADVNLLAGRVVMRQLFPLTATEAGAAGALDDVLRFGNLPLVRSERSLAGRADLLRAYVETYLTQEIRAEALVRRLDSFLRFLEVAALANAQVTNLAGIARDAGIARPTVQGHFDVLVDTLVGAWLPAWRPRAKIKEQAHPKFYFFDPGVVRALAGRSREPLDSAERGALLETLVFHELRAHLAYSACGGRLAYFGTPSGGEVDFVWTGARSSVGIEVKATTRWQARDARTLRALGESGTLRAMYGVYLGDRALRDGSLRVLPVGEFLRALAAGRILEPSQRRA